MTAFWRVAPWFARIPLVAAVAFFLFLAGQWLVDPAHVAVLAESGVKLDPGAATTNLRGTGALFVPLAAVMAWCALSRERLLVGLRLLVVIVAGTFATRWAIVAADGFTPLLARILRVESAVLVLAVGGLVLETRRRARVR